MKDPDYKFLQTNHCILCLITKVQLNTKYYGKNRNLLRIY